MVSARMRTFRRSRAAQTNGENRYRALADALPHLVAIVDRELQVVHVNARCEAYTGQRTEVINDTSAAWIVHRDDQYLSGDARAAIRSRTEFACDLRLRRADGVYRRHHVSGMPLAGVSGEPHEWLVIAADVEDRPFAPHSDGAETTNLREVNRLLVMAEEMAHVGHYRLDLVSNDVYWSAEVYNMYGLPLTFKPNLGWVLSAYHADDRDRVIEIIRETLTDGRAFAFSARVVRPDGTIRAVAAGGHVERTPNGKIVAIFGVLQDVTSFKDGERERGRLAERVMLATKAGKIGIWEWNVAANRLEWDTAMYTLYGIEDRTCAPTYDSWTACIHYADRNRAEAEIERALDGFPFESEFKVVWPAGNVRHLRTMGTLLHDPAGAGSRLVGATWDVTEVHVLADDLREEKERAEEATRAKSEFLARMSHEIRTPMNGIIGFTTLVLDGELSAEQRHFVTLLRDAGRSLLAIINDILDFSKLEAGKITLEDVPFNLHVLVDGAVSIVRGDAIGKVIALEASLASDVPVWVSGDPTRLRQILLNLLTNGVKFTERGSIRVGVKRDLLAPADYIRFEIVDTGIGIAPEQQHLLFRDFSQLEKSTTRRYGGTGLGLAICKHLVEAMGGTIGVESEPGVGSVFWFRARLRHVPTPLAAASDPPADLIAPRRILVADDNRVNQIVVEALLTRDGHQVVLTENGADAAEAVKRGHFDLVFMDMQMPVMDGIEATRVIRHLPGVVNTVPIIALTANAMDAEVELCRDAGMNGHLAKPIDRERLRAAIARFAHVDSEAPSAAPGSQETPKAVGLTDTPTLGVGTLLELFEGDLVAVGELFDAALASVESDRSRIEQSAEMDDMPSVVEAAHRMKGTTGSIRSQAVMEMSATIERAAKRNPATIDQALLDALDGAIAELKNGVEAYRRSARSAT
jgi:PAS domain S-box-containing protein